MARGTGTFHTTSNVYCVAPDIINEFVLTNYTRNNRTRVQADSKVKFDFCSLIVFCKVLVHACCKAEHDFCMLFVWSRNTAGCHVGVSNCLDFFYPHAGCTLIKKGNQRIKGAYNVFRRFVAGGFCKADNIREKNRYVLEAVCYCFFSGKTLHTFCNGSREYALKKSVRIILCNLQLNGSHLNLSFELELAFFVSLNYQIEGEGNNSQEYRNYNNPEDITLVEERLLNKDNCSRLLGGKLICIYDVYVEGVIARFKVCIRNQAVCRIFSIFIIKAIHHMTEAVLLTCNKAETSILNVYVLGTGRNYDCFRKISVFFFINLYALNLHKRKNILVAHLKRVVEGKAVCHGKPYSSV